MQRQRRAGAVMAGRRVRFHRVIVGNQGNQAGIRDPLQQFFVATVQRRAGVLQLVLVRLFLHFENHLREAGVQADHVTFFDHDLVLLHDAHELVVTDCHAFVADVRVQVDHHAAALHTVHRHVFDAEGMHRRRRLRRHVADRTGVVRVGRTGDFLAAAEAVIKHRLRLAVAIRIEQLAHVRQAIPLRRVLQVQDHGIVIDDIGRLRVVPLHDVDHVRPSVAQRRPQDRRMAARVEQVAAGVIQRQAQAEHLAFLDLGDALFHFLRRQQVQSSELVIRPEVAPGRTLGPVFPACRCSHCSPSSYYSQHSDFKTIPRCAPRRHEGHEGMRSTNEKRLVGGSSFSSPSRATPW